MLAMQKYVIAGLLIASFAFPAWGDTPLDGHQMPIVATSDLPNPRVQQKLDKLFYRWDSYELDLPMIELQARQTGRLKLHVGGRVFDLELEPHDLRALGHTSVRHTQRGPIEEKLPPVSTFKGHLHGDPESTVRLLIMKDFLQGYIRTSDEWIFIDPLLKYAKGSAPSKVVVFDDDDVRPEAGTACGAGELAHRAHSLDLHSVDSPYSSMTEKALITAPTLGRIDLATEADYEYYLRYGANTNNQILGIINQLDGIYRGDLALNLQVTYQRVWTATNAPYPYTSTNSNTLLTAFTDHWNTNQGHVARDLAHLFTGKSLDNSVRGIAWQSVLCNLPGSSYGLSQDYSMTTKIVAHEIGHNVGARHDLSGICTGSGPIMCSPLQQNGPNSFSDRSKDNITSHINNNGSCLTRLAMTSYTILTNQAPDTTMCGYGVYESGNRFTSTQDGYITALRFLKASGETGTHVGRLWTDSGAPLAFVTFTDETASGWQEQYLPFRVKITAGAYYWVTYNSNTCLAKTGCGLGTPITNGPLTATGGGYSNAGGGGTFPVNGSCSNFFADVYFTP